MSAGVVPSEERSLRIGEVAQQAATTPRTIRYYEEIGLLPAAPERERGAHRLYGAAEVERLKEIVRLRDLLGLTLDELREVMAAEDSRAQLRSELHGGDVDSARELEIMGEAITLIDRQLELVRRRRDEIAELEGDLVGRRDRAKRRARKAEATS